MATGFRESDEDLSSLFWKYFQVVAADSGELRRLTQRIRHQVYCLEHDFEAANADQVETDKFDLHCEAAILVHRPTSAPAGTVRLVLPLDDALDRSFPIQEVCTDSSVRDGRKFPLESMGEISRFCVAKAFRRRLQDVLIDLPVNSEADESESRRVIPNMTLGLMEWLVRFSRRIGLTHWFAIMEPQLIRLHARLGIHFEPIGDLVDYHGVRQPCYAEVEPMLRHIHEVRPDIWSVVAEPSEPFRQ